MNRSEALALVDTHHWKHSFEIVPGVFARGDWGTMIDSASMLDTIYGLPKDLSGMRALDIGALDGVHTFELERRGASVTALDIQNPDVTGFNIAKTIIGSRAEFVQGSVYDLTTLFKERFDVILFFGVWYHLKNPVRAFEQIAAVLGDEGTLCGEGECLRDYVEIGGQPGDAAAKALAEQMGRSDLAISVYYPQHIDLPPSLVRV